LVLPVFATIDGTRFRPYLLHSPLAMAVSAIPGGRIANRQKHVHLSANSLSASQQAYIAFKNASSVSGGNWLHRFPVALKFLSADGIPTEFLPRLVPSVSGGSRRRRPYYLLHRFPVATGFISFWWPLKIIGRCYTSSVSGGRHLPTTLDTISETTR
jgi:hypothetical protein